MNIFLPCSGWSTNVCVLHYITNDPKKIEYIIVGWVAKNIQYLFSVACVGFRRTLSNAKNFKRVEASQNCTRKCYWILKFVHFTATISKLFWGWINFERSFVLNFLRVLNFNNFISFIVYVQKLLLHFFKV